MSTGVPPLPLNWAGGILLVRAAVVISTARSSNVITLSLPSLYFFYRSNKWLFCSCLWVTLSLKRLQFARTAFLERSLLIEDGGSWSSRLLWKLWVDQVCTTIASFISLCFNWLQLPIEQVDKAGVKLQISACDSLVSWMTSWAFLCSVCQSVMLHPK